MALQTSPLTDLLEKYDRALPHFSDGRIDYTNAKEAAVLTAFVRHGQDFLLLKRSSKVGSYAGLWNAVAGYIDQLKPLREKVLEELSEELGVGEASVLSIRFAPGIIQEDQELGRIWMVYPVLVTLSERPSISLDFEHTESAWAKKEDFPNYEKVPGFNETFQAVSGLL